MTSPDPAPRMFPGRLRRAIKFAGLLLIAMATVMLLPAAPAQQPARDLGTVRTETDALPPQAATGRVNTGANAPADAQPPVTTYRPFIDPLPVSGVHKHWYLLLLPMSFGVAVVYKAVALQTMERYWQQVGYMTLQILVGMILLAVASYLLVMLYVPFMAAR